MRLSVVVQLTEHQAFRCEKLWECLRPPEKLTVAEISQRLPLEYLLWVKSERKVVESRA